MNFRNPGRLLCLLILLIIIATISLAFSWRNPFHSTGNHRTSMASDSVVVECSGIAVLSVEFTDYTKTVQIPPGKTINVNMPSSLDLRDYRLTIQNTTTKPIVSITFSIDRQSSGKSKIYNTTLYYNSPLLPGQERLQPVYGIGRDDKLSIATVIFDDGTSSGSEMLAQKYLNELRGAKGQHSREIANLRMIVELPDDQMLSGVTSMIQRLTNQLHNIGTYNSGATESDAMQAQLRGGEKSTIEVYLPILKDLQQMLEKGDVDRARSRLRSVIIGLDSRYSLLK